MLELEELPLLVLCSGLSMMGSVLLRSGLLQGHKENHQLRPQGLQGLPKLTDSFTVRRRLVCWGRQGQVFSLEATDPASLTEIQGS